MKIVTFLSDFGLSDGYVAQVKGSILSGFSEVSIIDITHEIPPFDIISGAWLLSAAYASFPPGTIHLAVVDPGVGTDRSIVCLQKDGHIFIGPDNGILSFLAPFENFLEITWRPTGRISPSFHARDVFAPILVEILKGRPLDELGFPMADPVLVDISSPMVVHIDRFGNIITNIPISKVSSSACVRIAGRKIGPLAGNYYGITPGRLGLIGSGANTLEIAGNQVSASGILDAYTGMKVKIIQKDE